MNTTSNLVRLLLFFLLLGIVEFVLALQFGLGWLILFEALRRTVSLFPQIYVPILRTLAGIEFVDWRQISPNERDIRLLYVRRILNAVLWLLLTIVVFLYANIRLIDLLNIK